MAANKPPRVLDVGQCQPDHGAIRRMLQREFGADVVQAHDLTDALRQLRAGPFSLVLVNRKLDADYSDGMEIIQRLKADPDLARLPAMLISNHAEYQQSAVAAGAEYGFGKAELDQPATRNRLAAVLEPGGD